MEVPVNYLAVSASGVAAMILGSVWYGPLFGKQWMAMMGLTPEKTAAMKADPAAKKKMMRSYGLMFLGALVMAYVLSHALAFAQAYIGSKGAMAGVSVGFWNWLGFIVPVTMGSVLWESRPWKLWALNAGYYLVQLVMMGVILALWK